MGWFSFTPRTELPPLILLALPKFGVTCGGGMPALAEGKRQGKGEDKTDVRVETCKSKRGLEKQIS